MDDGLKHNKKSINGKGHQGKQSKPIEEQLDIWRKVAGFYGFLDLLGRLPPLGQGPAARARFGQYFNVIAWRSIQNAVGNEGDQEDDQDNSGSSDLGVFQNLAGSSEGSPDCGWSHSVASQV